MARIAPFSEGLEAGPGGLSLRLRHRPDLDGQAAAGGPRLGMPQQPGHAAFGLHFVGPLPSAFLFLLFG